MECLVSILTHEMLKEYKEFINKANVSRYLKILEQRTNSKDSTIKRNKRKVAAQTSSVMAVQRIAQQEHPESGLSTYQTHH